MNKIMEKNNMTSSTLDFFKDMFSCGSMSTVFLDVTDDSEFADTSSIVLTTNASSTHTPSPTYDCEESVTDNSNNINEQILQQHLNGATLPSTESLKQRMIPMLVNKSLQQQQEHLNQPQYSTISSVSSIQSFVCGSSVNDVADDENLMREGSVSASTLVTCPTDEDSNQKQRQTTNQSSNRHRQKKNKKKQSSTDNNDHPSSPSKSGSYRYTIRLSPDKDNYQMSKNKEKDVYPELTLRKSHSMSTLPSMISSSSSMSSISKE